MTFQFMLPGAGARLTPSQAVSQALHAVVSAEYDEGKRLSPERSAKLLTEARDALLDFFAEEARVNSLSKTGESYAQLERLDAFMKGTFPGMKVQGTDSALDSVRRALEILEMVKTYVPAVTMMLWHSVVQPTIHILKRYGIDVPMPPSDRPHRMD